MERADWVLLTTGAAGSRGLDPVQLQKCLFLLGQNCPQIAGQPYYQFEPYNYGPFDVAVYRDAEELERSGLVSIRRPASRKWGQYFVTPEGAERAQQLRAQELDPSVSRYIQTLVDWAKGMTFQDLIKTIYQHYPEFQANSVFRD